MKYLMPVLFLFLFIGVNAQTDSIANSKKLITKSEAVFTKVEVEPEFPGGPAAFMRFLQQNLKYPKKAYDRNLEGTVMVQFIVSETGKLSDISAIAGPEALREAATKIFLHSPDWIPAQQNGYNVRAYKKVPITYSLNR